MGGQYLWLYLWKTNHWLYQHLWTSFPRKTLTLKMCPGPVTWHQKESPGVSHISSTWKEESKKLETEANKEGILHLHLTFHIIQQSLIYLSLSFIPYLLNTQHEFLQGGPALVLSLPICLSFPSVFFFCLVLFFFILLLLGSPKGHRVAWFAGCVSQSA